MHEVFGQGALFFAAAFAGGTSGPFFWVRERWRSEQLNPEGLADMFGPASLLLARADSQIDVLAVAEECLRDGAVKCVILELSKPLDLTAGRRLQLAAKAGKSTAIAIISEGMGSNASETRWECTPLFDPEDSTLQRWELKKNKSGTLGAWNVRWSASSRRIHVVSEARL